MSLASCTAVPAESTSEAEGSETSQKLDNILVSLNTLKTDVAEIKTQLTTIGASGGTAAKAGGGANASATPEEESKAAELKATLTGHIQTCEMSKAKGVMATLDKTYKNTSAWKSLQRRTAPEIAVIGRKVTSAKVSPEIKDWYVDGQVDLDSGVTLVVFWEIWCPHCKREMPELVELYNKKSDDGLKILGLTRLTKSSTEEKVRAFVDEHDLNYPVAKESGKVAPLFNVSGIPAAAVVKDGEIVWRGHPNGLTEACWDKWLN
jgi:thiol-disulfide isomerase/thioredoxin